MIEPVVEMTPDYVRSRALALTLLKGRSDLSVEVIRTMVDIAINTGKSAGGGDVNADALSREIEGLLSIWVGTGKTLDDPTGHDIWLPDHRAKIGWDFWRRYEAYLEDELGWPPQIVNRLGDLTDSILERLENPQRPAPWDRRGMVVGSVQSGKTANYTGLICKAVDAGYKLVIILAGMHNSLRSQTQLRIDEGVLGFDTKQNRRFNQENSKIGVGRIPFKLLYIHSLTNSEEQGDFNKRVANQIGVTIGGDPVILVVKKNKSVLHNLIQWALVVRGQKDVKTDRKIIHDVPLLVIDDEADTASVNTRAPGDGEDPNDYEPSAINKKIRELLGSFNKVAYVGYTATPFANIFIDPDEKHDELGDDIFPRSFIINLPVSTSYVGPTRVFGLDADPDANIEGVESLPIVRTIDDYITDFPEKHDKHHRPTKLPPSLKEALRAFILVCAARRVRGQVSSHNSMLIHVTRFVDVQGYVAELVSDELANLKRRIAYGDGNASEGVRTELRQLWEQDFEPTIAKMQESNAVAMTWQQIDNELHNAVSKIDIKKINGTARDILDYMEHPHGRSVIAIGGDKLARGLTLEGLSVSYYLRASKMYDTLMQMGRWFGYRPGYLDLCRLYTTRQLVNWYRHITLAEQELRREFDYMSAANLTPTDYGLRVRTHPEGLFVTALNKMRHGEKMMLSYTGELVQTTHLHKDPNTIRINFEITAEFISSLGPSKRRNKRDVRLWQDVKAERIINIFLNHIAVHPQCLQADPSRLAQYITKQNEQGDLSNWTVALISDAKKTNKSDIGTETEVGLIERQPADNSTSTVYALRKSNIISPTDQYLDFDDAETMRALEFTRQRFREGEIKTKDNKEPDVPNGRIVRELRPDSNGLLLIYPLDPSKAGINSENPVIGFAISFPVSERAQPIEYMVNKVLLKTIFDSMETDGDDE